MLSNTWDMEDLVVLDLFAGTGSIGFEFASRGAGRVDMVELDQPSARFLKRTIQTLAAGNIRVFNTDALDYIRKSVSRYDIVFADPPYKLEAIPEIPDRVLDSGILEAEGWFILEHGRKNSFSGHSRLTGTRKYGNVNFSIFT